MIKIIIFDLWSTLCYKKYTKGDTAHLSKEIKKPFRKVLKTYEKHFQLDRSTDFEKKYENMFKELKIKFDRKLVEKYAKHRKKQEIVCEDYRYTLPLLKILKKRYKIAVLSNTTFVSGNKVLKSPLSKYVDKFFFSYETKVIKPDPKAFKKVLSYFKVKPSEALMIGNTYQDDVVPARKIGMKAVLFRDEKQIIHDLKKIGVIR